MLETNMGYKSNPKALVEDTASELFQIKKNMVKSTKYYIGSSF